MKWRERISILSRKRKNTRNAPAEETQNETAAPSGSTYISERENVNKTLSQIRPVIGPDLKSYYILLRGNEDSFTCIQPAKEVVTSLDEVVRNVVNSVKDCRAHGIVLPPYLKTSRGSEGRSHRNISRKPGSNSTGNGFSDYSRNEMRLSSGLSLENVFNIKPEEKFLGTENVVENVVLNRTIQTINSNHNEVTRTSTLVYPLVQNRLDSSNVGLGTEKKSSSKKPVSLKRTATRGIPQEPEISSFRANSHTVSNASVTRAKEEPEVRINGDITSDVVKADETLPTELEGLIVEVSPVTEIRLLAKEGCVLTEESIIEQVKALIESETITVGDDSHIEAVRGTPQEVILRITSRVPDDSPIFAAQTLKDEDFDIPSDILDVDEGFREEETSLSLPDPTLQEDICYDPDLVVNSNGNCDLENRVEYLLTSMSSSPSEIFEDCDVVKNSELAKVIQEEEEADAISGYCMLNPSIEDTDELEVEKFLNGHSILSQNEEIVVFQRADGALVNQDGTPVSSELQYLIATSQSDDQNILPDPFTNNIFLSAKP